MDDCGKAKPDPGKQEQIGAPEQDRHHPRLPRDRRPAPVQRLNRGGVMEDGKGSQVRQIGGPLWLRVGEIGHETHTGNQETHCPEAHDRQGRGQNDVDQHKLFAVERQPAGKQTHEQQVKDRRHHQRIADEVDVACNLAVGDPGNEKKLRHEQEQDHPRTNPGDTPVARCGFSFVLRLRVGWRQEPSSLLAVFATESKATSLKTDTL